MSSLKCDYRWRAVETMEGLQVFTVCVTHDKQTSFSVMPCKEDPAPKVDAVVASILGHMDLHTKYPMLEEDQL